MNGKPTESEHFAGILPYPVRFCKYCINEIKNFVKRFKKGQVLPLLMCYLALSVISYLQNYMLFKGE